MKYVDDPKDLQKMANISKKYKKNTKAVFKVLGKRVIKGIVKGSAKIIKWTYMLVAQLLSLFISVLWIIRKIVLIVIDRFVDLVLIPLWIIWKIVLGKVLNFIGKLLYNKL